MQRMWQKPRTALYQAERDYDTATQHTGNGPQMVFLRRAKKVFLVMSHDGRRGRRQEAVFFTSLCRARVSRPKAPPPSTNRATPPVFPPFRPSLPAICYYSWNV